MDNFQAERIRNIIKVEFEKFFSDIGGMLGDVGIPDCEGDESGNWFLGRRLEADEGVPETILNARSFYSQNADGWLWARIYLTFVDENKIYAILATSDGSDGWLEIFDGKGNLVGVARTVSHFLDWGEPDVIRSSVLTLGEELTPELDKCLAELRQGSVTGSAAP